MPQVIKLAICHTLSDLKAAVALMEIDAESGAELVADESFFHYGVEISTIKYGDNKVRVNLKVIKDNLWD